MSRVAAAPPALNCRLLPSNPGAALTPATPSIPNKVPERERHQPKGDQGQDDPHHTGRAVPRRGHHLTACRAADAGLGGDGAAIGTAREAGGDARPAAPSRGYCQLGKAASGRLQQWIQGEIQGFSPLLQNRSKCDVVKHPRDTPLEEKGPVVGPLSRLWSGRGDSNPRPSPWQEASRG
jgi:hypothetical protein